MGIKVTTTYSCDICHKSEDIEPGNVPIHWRKLTIASYDGYTTERAYIKLCIGRVICDDCYPKFDEDFRKVGTDGN